MEPVIYGAPKWADPNAFFDQGNNPTEHLLRVRPTSGSPLETCGPTAALNCLASVGSWIALETPGGYQPQPEEVLCDWFNDQRNFSTMRAAWAGLDPANVPGNEVAQWYPAAVAAVFGLHCEFVGALTLLEGRSYLKDGCALQVCLQKPGHFLALVACDDGKQQFIIKDSWGTRWPRGDGFCQRISWQEFETNTRPLNLVYRPEARHARP